MTYMDKSSGRPVIIAPEEWIKEPGEIITDEFGWEINPGSKPIIYEPWG